MSNLLFWNLIKDPLNADGIVISNIPRIRKSDCMFPIFEKSETSSGRTDPITLACRIPCPDQTQREGRFAYTFTYEEGFVDEYHLLFNSLCPPDKLNGFMMKNNERDRNDISEKLHSAVQTPIENLIPIEYTNIQTIEKNLGIFESIVRSFRNTVYLDFNLDTARDMLVLQRCIDLIAKLNDCGECLSIYLFIGKSLTGATLDFRKINRSSELVVAHKLVFENIYFISQDLGICIPKELFMLGILSDHIIVRQIDGDDPTGSQNICKVDTLIGNIMGGYIPKLWTHVAVYARKWYPLSSHNMYTLDTSHRTVELRQSHQIALPKNRTFRKLENGTYVSDISLKTHLIVGSLLSEYEVAYNILEYAFSELQASILTVDISHFTDSFAIDEELQLTVEHNFDSVEYLFLTGKPRDTTKIDFRFHFPKLKALVLFNIRSMEKHTLFQQLPVSRIESRVYELYHNLNLPLVIHYLPPTLMMLTIANSTVSIHDSPHLHKLKHLKITSSSRYRIAVGPFSAPNISSDFINGWKRENQNTNIRRLTGLYVFVQKMISESTETVCAFSHQCIAYKTDCCPFCDTRRALGQTPVHSSLHPHTEQILVVHIGRYNHLPQDVSILNKSMEKITRCDPVPDTLDFLKYS